MPITATYYAAVDTSKYSVSLPSNDIMGDYADTESLKKNTPISNYAAFFGKGIPLNDRTLVLAETDTYLGFIGNVSYLTIYFSEPTLIKNGITIVFDRCACKTIEVYESGSLKTLGDNTSEEFELIRPIPFETQTPVSELTVHFYGVPEGDIMTLKGIVLGVSMDINEFFEFNQLTEICPLGDDLPLNEISSTAYLENKFYDEEGQEIVYYDGQKISEDTFLIESEFEQKNHFMVKSQNILSNFSNAITDYAFNKFSELGVEEDWSNLYFTVEEALAGLLPSYVTVKYPEWFGTYKISAFLEPSTARKILQQIAWACCCGIKTSNMSKTIEFVPFLADDTVTPKIVISNEDNRILKTKVKKGENYGTVIWEYSKYTRSEETSLGEITPTLLSAENEEYLWGITFDKPTQFLTIGTPNSSSEHTVTYITPYSAGGTVFLASQRNQHVRGGLFTEQKQRIEIDLEGSSDKILTISNQILFPFDTASKVAQLKKWYSKNNTLSATIVDNGDIKIGEILKIQLDNEKYFTGIITKIERKNISDYHVLEVEAHEWD